MAEAWVVQAQNYDKGAIHYTLTCQRFIMGTYMSFANEIIKMERGIAEYVNV